MKSKHKFSKNIWRSLCYFQFVACWLTTFGSDLNIFWIARFTPQINVLWTNIPKIRQLVRNGLTIPGFLGIPAGTSTREQPFTQSANCSSPKWELTSLIVSMWLRSFPTPIKNKTILKRNISTDCVVSFSSSKLTASKFVHFHHGFRMYLLKSSNNWLFARLLWVFHGCFKQIREVSWRYLAFYIGEFA